MIPEHYHLSFPLHFRLHIGICGSIAAYKALDLCRSFQSLGLQVGATLTQAGSQFITPLALTALGADPVYTELFAPRDSVYAHLEPGQTSRAFLVAPASANTLAKMANGLADTMLSCQLLAAPCPVVIAPAMNPNLWEAQATQENVRRLSQRDNMTIISPDSGHVACGDHGTGRLASGPELIWNTLRCMAKSDLQGRKILINLGPTREFWDPVRFWSNPSSGKMGAAMALTAWLRGAEVHCVCGPTEQWLPQAIPCTRVCSAREMNEACLDLWPGADIGCLAAAVCDFRPAAFSDHKFKKNSLQGELNISFSSNPDILRALGEQKKPHQSLIGFAAESEAEYEPLVLQKLARKKLDCIVANRITQQGTGFGSPTNSVTVFFPGGQSHPLHSMSKADVAWKIWDLICAN
ncbi:MAG: bifunctional phosphopantothenoylcysteine decarboxylase/phosphopantothenate--cysteine ligase CoaBC [Desulfovermiculus sp.]